MPDKETTITNTNLERDKIHYSASLCLHTQDVHIEAQVTSPTENAKDLKELAKELFTHGIQEVKRKKLRGYE